MRHTKIFLIAIIAVISCACEKKEYWEHETPDNPVIAHIMCIQINTLPQDGYYTFNMYNTLTHATCDRAKWAEMYCTQKELPIKLYVNGGQRLDKEKYALSVLYRSTQDTETDILCEIGITDFIELKQLYEATGKYDTKIGFTNSDAHITGVYHIRYD